MDYILEIGTEELPAGTTSKLLDQFHNLFIEKLDEFEIREYNINKYSTPRRLVLMVQNLPNNGPERTFIITGPGVQAPLEAVESFAHKNSITTDQLEIVNNRYTYHQTLPPTSIEDILTQATNHSILNIKGPKWMSWHQGIYNFSRPIRWVMSLLDDKVVPLEVFGVQSNRYTRPNRQIEALQTNYTQYLEIPHTKEYRRILTDNLVNICPESRKESIVSQVKELEEIHQLQAIWEDDLLDEIIDLLEYPLALVGEFDKQFLDLPDFLTQTILNKHQRYFACKTLTGTLSNKFIIIANCLPESTSNVITGNEKVLKARLKDGEFFTQEDLLKPLESRTTDLEQMTFQQELTPSSTMQHKVNRLVSMASLLATRLNLPESQQKDLEQVAILAKQDLASSIVFEFPELQGLAGGYIAQHQGCSSNISQAISEQYLPSGYNSALPTCELGSLISLLDKVDNIVSLFFIEKIPTGSSDPFALRRQTQGIIEILLSSQLASTSLSLYDLFKIAFTVLAQQMSLSNTDFDKFLTTIHKKKISLEDFILQRIIHILPSDTQLNKAIVSSHTLSLSLYQVNELISETIQNKKSMLNLAPNIRRISRILKDYASSNIGTIDLSHQASFTQNLQKQYISLQKTNSWEAFDTFSRCIEIFFDNVLVEDPDNPQDTAQRKELLYQIKVFCDQKFCHPNWEALVNALESI